MVGVIMPGPAVAVMRAASRTRSAAHEIFYPEVGACQGPLKGFLKSKIRQLNGNLVRVCLTL